jgi:hypothetical protein
MKRNFRGLVGLPIVEYHPRPRSTTKPTHELTQDLEEDWAETVSVMVDLELKSFLSSTSQRSQDYSESPISRKARNSQGGCCRDSAGRPSLRTIRDFRLVV